MAARVDRTIKIRSFEGILGRLSIRWTMYVDFDPDLGSVERMGRRREGR